MRVVGTSIIINRNVVKRAVELWGAEGREWLKWYGRFLDFFRLDRRVTRNAFENLFIAIHARSMLHNRYRLERLIDSCPFFKRETSRKGAEYIARVSLNKALNVSRRFKRGKQFEFDTSILKGRSAAWSAALVEADVSGRQLSLATAGKETGYSKATIRRGVKVQEIDVTRRKVELTNRKDPAFADGFLGVLRRLRQFVFVERGAVLAPLVNRYGFGNARRLITRDALRITEVVPVDRLTKWDEASLARRFGEIAPDLVRST